MMSSKTAEEKRSLIWRVIVIVTTIVIMIVIVSFIARIFVVNPILGYWVSDEEQHISLEISDKTIVINLHEIDKSAKVNYTLDKEAYMINYFDIESDNLDNTFFANSTSYTYSIAGDTLTLTDRESGEMCNFTKED